MTGLEQRYRRVLRLLPVSYRRVREDDMVVAFLQRTVPEDAEDAVFTAEHGWPSGAEVARVAVAVLAFSVVSFCHPVPVFGGVPLLVATCWLLAAALPVLALAAFHPESPPVRPRPWLVALPVGLVLTAMLFILPMCLGYPMSVDLPGFACLLAAVAGVAYLVAPGLGWGGPEASWPAALALLGLGALGLPNLGRGGGAADATNSLFWEMAWTLQTWPPAQSDE